jgi:UDP-GlcNAc:undecaprenyl-phosphate/decaprenyl-phosphate GlcNAc-1-phosphate transferase
MNLNNFFLILFLLAFSLFYYKYFLLILKKYNPKLLVDNQYSKPQAFHERPVSTGGGLYICVSLIIIFFNFVFFNNIFFVEYLSFCTLFFIIGFLDDLQINIEPKIRLALMILLLIVLIKSNDFYIINTGITVLDRWLLNSNLFSLVFVIISFLFVINGANLIDGYNGLLGIHSLIIIINLCIINYINENYNLATILFFVILILIIFLKFNFPKANVFLGDGGSYILGTFIAVTVIKTSIENPNISPFYFCILLFYLFFEVFFSFFRKLLKEKKSPIHPDKKHLHMILYKKLLKKNKSKFKSNYQVSLILNLSYFVLIIPAIFMQENGMFCKYYSIVFFIVYIFSYITIYKEIK